MRSRRGWMDQFVLDEFREGHDLAILSWLPLLMETIWINCSLLSHSAFVLLYKNRMTKVRNEIT